MITIITVYIAKSDEDGFADYWNEFQSAVVSGSESRVASLMEFPLRVLRFEKDSIRNELLDGNGFRKIYVQLFNKTTVDLIKKLNLEKLGHKYIPPEKAEREGIPGASFVYYFDIPYEIRDEKRVNVINFIRTETGYTLFVLIAKPVNSTIQTDDIYLSQERNKK
jgi:hypothetical protein